MDRPRRASSDPADLQHRSQKKDLTLGYCCGSINISTCHFRPTAGPSTPTLTRGPKNEADIGVTAEFAFTPTKTDKGLLSADREAVISLKDAYERYLEQKKLDGDGALWETAAISAIRRTLLFKMAG